MTFWNALGFAAGGMVLLATFLALVSWSAKAWVDGEWLERAANFAVWIVAIALVVYFANTYGTPA